ncbi:MAG: putative Cytochrome c [Nitrospira sp.]|jgi:mono/diheme cytochrome c family protein
MNRNIVKPLQMKAWMAGIGLVALVAAFPACESNATNQDGAKPAAGATPADVQAGEAKFSANCAACHGVRAVGTKQGPPLVHKIYEPNHHADMAFQRAAENGVRAHHWEFGNMPKIEGVTSADVEQIIRYVRWLQREAGIY